MCRMLMAAPALSGFEVELEITVPFRDLRHSSHRTGRQWGASQVRVHQNAGCVQGASQRGMNPLLEPGSELGVQPAEALAYVFGARSSDDTLPKIGENRARGLHQGPAAELTRERLDARLGEELLYAGDAPQEARAPVSGRSALRCL